jgi:hypothetical protein
MQIILLVLRSKCDSDTKDSNKELSQINLNESAENIFEFVIDITDTLFILTRNNSLYKENMGNIISKMVVISEPKNINLSYMSEILGGIGIDKLNIFSINKYLDIKLDIHTTNKGCELKYIEINSDEFVKFLNHENGDFLDYNKNSLYIVRGGDFIDVKNIFAIVNNCRANIGRGGSQKAHILSPLDLRLSSYLMAMFNFDYKLINNLNTFNYISKDRYLS